ncbi:hypothetical protein GCM10017750_68410 [Streptomyces racemochromogenes]
MDGQREPHRGRQQDHSDEIGEDLPKATGSGLGVKAHQGSPAPVASKDKTGLQRGGPPVPDGKPQPATRPYAAPAPSRTRGTPARLSGRSATVSRLYPRARPVLQGRHQRRGPWPAAPGAVTGVPPRPPGPPKPGTGKFR